MQTRQTVKKGDVDGKAAVKLSTIQTVKKILKEEGPLGFWKGVIPALILVVNPIIQYTAFERLKEWLIQRRKKLTGATNVALGGFDFFLLGALSKLTATSITYPYM